MTPRQFEGEDRDSLIGAIFVLMLERKAREFPDLKAFLNKAGMSIGYYAALRKGEANPTAYTLEKTARALGVSPWELLGANELLIRSYLRDQGIDLDRVTESVKRRVEKRAEGKTVRE